MRSPMSRILSWASFYLLATWQLVRLKKCDVLVTMTTPPGLSVAGVLAARLLKSKLWIWEMDLYPDVVSATSGTINQGKSLALNMLGRILTWSRKRASGIIALGECMKHRLITSGVPPVTIHVCQNWAESSPLSPASPGSGAPLRILYSGNLGMAHDVNTIFLVLEELASEPRIQFVFAGGGAGREELERRCARAGLNAVTFKTYGDRLAFQTNLAECDLGLVTLKQGCEGTVVPSKVYSLMAAGRPVLFIGPANSTPAYLVQEHQCGWSAKPGDFLQIAGLLRSLLEQPEEICARANRAKSVFLQHFDVSHGTARIASILLREFPATSGRNSSP